MKFKSKKQQDLKNRIDIKGLGVVAAKGVALQEFTKAIKAGTSGIVKSKKVYFRFNKLKCKVKMINEKNELVCRGTISGMIIV